MCVCVCVCVCEKFVSLKFQIMRNLTTRLCNNNDNNCGLCCPG